MKAKFFNSPLDIKDLFVCGMIMLFKVLELSAGMSTIILVPINFFNK